MVVPSSRRRGLMGRDCLRRLCADAGFESSASRRLSASRTTSWHSPDATEGPHRSVRPLGRWLRGERGQEPELLSLLPASLNLLLTWFFRNTTAAMTASAMRATRRMYSTIEAPFSSLANFAWSQVRVMNRFMGWLPLLGSEPHARLGE